MHSPPWDFPIGSLSFKLEILNHLDHVRLVELIDSNWDLDKKTNLHFKPVKILNNTTYAGPREEAAGMLAIWARAMLGINLHFQSFCLSLLKS